MLDRLEAADRTAELHALLDVLRRQFEEPRSAEPTHSAASATRAPVERTLESRASIATARRAHVRASTATLLKVTRAIGRVRSSIVNRSIVTPAAAGSTTTTLRPAESLAFERPEASLRRDEQRGRKHRHESRSHRRRRA
jgi:hypothetical protein